MSGSVFDNYIATGLLVPLYTVLWLFVYNVDNYSISYIHETIKPGKTSIYNLIVSVHNSLWAFGNT